MFAKLGSALLTVSLLAAHSASAATIAGNGASGFGGPIGTGSLSVNETTPGTISFSLTTGAPFSGNALILYIDSQTGGVGSNSALTDTSDPGRTAISGLSNNGRSLVTFPVGFTADYAATVEPGSFSGLYALATPASFGFVSSGNLAGAGSGPFTFSFTRGQLGLAPSGGSFSVLGTLISTSAYRSNETFGASVTLPAITSPGDAPNAGFTGTQVFATSLLVPEPTTLGVFGGLATIALRRRK